MNYVYLIIVVAVVFVVVAYSLWPLLRARRSGRKPPTDGMRQLLAHGIGYEEEFIEQYLTMTRDEGFMRFFGAKEAEARTIIDVLISESREHKATLEAISAKINP